MKKLGISIYPEIVGKNETLLYIDKAMKYGFKRIFANLIEIENNAEGQKKLEMLSSVYKYASSLGFEVIVDVNPSFYKEFNLNEEELMFFKNLGATGIRLDEDFKGVVEAKLSNNNIGMKVELNASATSTTFELALKNKANPTNIIACHNFYPLLYTGLDKNRFIELSTFYKLNNIRVAAFITLPQEQKGIGPWNVNNGMPTIEEDRFKALEDQLIDMLTLDLVDDIIVSQQGLTEQQFKLLSDIMVYYNKTKDLEEVEVEVSVLETTTAIEEDIIFNNHGNLHTNRPDFSERMYRSTWSRVYYKGSEIKPHNMGKELLFGDVVILNENLGRYKGELHVILGEINDSQNGRNVVGKIKLQQLKIFKLLKHKKIKFIKKEVNYE